MRLAQPDKPHLAALDQPAHLADRVLDRHVGVDPVLVIEVDDVDPEPLQAHIAGLPDVFRAAVDAVGAAGFWVWPNLVARTTLSRLPFKRAAEQLLVLAPAVHVGAVEMVDPEVDRLVQELDRRLVVAGAVGAGQRHAAEPDRQHLRPVAPDPPPLPFRVVAHRVLPKLWPHHNERRSFATTGEERRMIPLGVGQKPIRDRRERWRVRRISTPGWPARSA